MKITSVNVPLKFAVFKSTLLMENARFKVKLDSISEYSLDKCKATCVQHMSIWLVFQWS